MTTIKIKDLEDYSFVVRTSAQFHDADEDSTMTAYETAHTCGLTALVDYLVSTAPGLMPPLFILVSNTVTEWLGGKDRLDDENEAIHHLCGADFLSFVHAAHLTRTAYLNRAGAVAAPSALLRSTIVRMFAQMEVGYRMSTHESDTLDWLLLVHKVVKIANEGAGYV